MQVCIIGRQFISIFMSLINYDEFLTFSFAVEVERLLNHVASAGGTIIKPGQRADWGGYTGYFSDPDGFLWEVAWTPDFPHI